MIQIIKNSWLSLAMLILIVFLGIGTRFYLLEKNFTHIDDIGVAQTIIERDVLYKNVDDRYETIWKQKILNGEKGKINQIIGTGLNDLYLLKHVYVLSRYWLDVLHAVPSAWTYAPGQFYLTNILVDSDQSYLQSKFWGRLPSFIFGTFSLFLLIFLFVKLYGLREGLSLSVVSTSILSLSWENIIFSSQMESYAVGNFSILLLFGLLLYLYRKPPFKLKGWFLVGMIFAIPGIFQYQALLFVVPAAISLVVSIKDKFYIKDLVKAVFVASIGFIFTFLALIYPYLKDNIGRGVSSNIGSNDMFLLSLNWQEGFVSITKDVAHFIFNYFPEVVGSVLSPTVYNYSTVYFIGWLLIIISIVGIRSMLRSSGDRKILAIFVLASLFVYLLALLFQVLALSPTRHSIVLGCLLLLFIPEGLMILLKSTLTIGGLQAGSLIFSIIWLLLFIPNIKEIVNNREDPFDEVKIFQQLKHDEIDLIAILDNSHQLHLMPSIMKKYPALDGNLWFEDSTTKEERSRLARNYGSSDNQLLYKRNLNIALFSGDNCWSFNDIKGSISSFVLRYGFNHEANLVHKHSECLKKEATYEYSSRAPDGSNIYSYNVVEISKE